MGDILIWIGLIGAFVLLMTQSVIMVRKIKSIAVKIFIACATLIILGLIINQVFPGPTAPRKAERVIIGQTEFNHVNERVVELAWNGGPKEGLNLSGILPMQVGDRIVIYWLGRELGGCLQPHHLFGCYAPWGLLDIPSANLALFENRRGQFAVQIWHGDQPQKIERWARGAEEMVISVHALPLRMYLNTMVHPGIYFGARGVRVSIDEYHPPIGRMYFRIVNQNRSW